MSGWSERLRTWGGYLKNLLLLAWDSGKTLTIDVYVTGRTSLAGSTCPSMGGTPVTAPLSTDKIDVSIDSNSQKDSGDTLAKEMIIRGPGHSLLRLDVRLNITEAIHRFVGNQRTAVI